MKKTNIVIGFTLLVILLIAFQAQKILALFSPAPFNTATTAQHVKHHSSSVVEQDSLETSVKSTHKSLTKIVESSMLSCEGFSDAQRIFSQQQTRYIVEAATNSYFNGVDKTTILDTLASEYNIATSFIFLENIASKSVHHNDFKKYNTVLKEQLSKGESFSQSQTPYLEISPWSAFYSFNGSAVERANLQVINYPDIATSLWIRTADASVHSEDFQGLQYSIGQLAKHDYHPIENAFIVRQLAIIIMQAPFTRAQKQSIINDLSAVNSATFYYPSSLQLHQVASQGNHLLRLNHFKMDVSAINFIELSQLTFNTNEQLLAKWQLLLDKFHIQKPEPKGDIWCDKNDPKKPIHKITKVSLKPYIEQENYSLFSEFLSQCMLIDNMMEIGFFISQQGWELREIFSVESMQDVSFSEKANQLKQQFPDQLSGIFSFESTNSLTDFNNRTQQLSLLIDHGLYPRNANIAMAMRKLSIEESMTLIKKAGDIEPINKYKATLVYNAVLSNNPSLAIALINQGYPLTTEENAPDPLQAYLMQLTMSRRKLDRTLLDVLMANTPQITQWHINSVYRMKLNNHKEIQTLIDAYPELYPAEPESLLTIDCDGQYIQFQ